VSHVHVGDELEGKVPRRCHLGAFVESLRRRGVVHYLRAGAPTVGTRAEGRDPVTRSGCQVLGVDSARPPSPLSGQRVEDQILPLGCLPGTPRHPPRTARRGSLDDVPDLGLSEDVFADAPAWRPRGELAELDRKCR